MRPQVPVEGVTPGEAAPTGGTGEGLLPRVSPLVFLQRLAAREAGPALVAAVFLGLVVDALLVFPHVPQLREALPADGAEVRLLPRVNAPVDLQVLARVKALLADGAAVRPLPAVLPQVPLQALRAGEAALAHGAPEGLLPGVGAAVAAQLRGLEEAHLAVGASVRLLRPLLVRFLVRFAVGQLGEGFAADVAEEGLLPGVHPGVAGELVELAEGLHAVHTLVGLPRLLGVRALVSLQPGRAVEYFATVGTGMLVGLVVPVQVPGHLLLRREALVTPLAVVHDPGRARVNGSVPLQLRGPVEDLTADGAGVKLARTVAFRLPKVLFLDVRRGAVVFRFGNFLCEDFYRTWRGRIKYLKLETSGDGTAADEDVIRVKKKKKETTRQQRNLLSSEDSLLIDKICESVTVEPRNTTHTNEESEDYSGAGLSPILASELQVQAAEP